MSYQPPLSHPSVAAGGPGPSAPGANAIKNRRRASIRFFSHVLSLIKFIWPVFSMLIILIMLLGLITGIREGWTIGDSLYYAFITAFTIGYGDLAPKYQLTKTLAVVIGLVGFLFTGILVAIAVESIRYTVKGKTPLDTDEE